jgi:hypothetical protein
MSLKKLIPFAVIATLVLGSILGCGKGEKTATPQEKVAMNKPIVMHTSTVTLNATVEAVDMENRTFTLKDESGNTQTFQVKQEDAPLDKLKPGMPVKMTVASKDLYYVAAEGSQIPENVSEAEMEKTGTDKGIVVIREQNQSYTVKAVDTEKRTLQLSADGGNPFELQVQENAVDLSKLKPGDTIVNKSVQVVTIMIQ